MWGAKVRDALRVLSYSAFSDSYRVYRTTKYVYSLLHRDTLVAEEPDYDGACLMIEGFVHSGNSFLRSNVEKQYQGKVIGHRHRPWVLKEALRREIPAGLLIRDPVSVARSMCHRSMVNGSTPISYASALACWILFYRQAWSYRHSLVILPFERLVSDYDSLCEKLETISEVRFTRPPIRLAINKFTGPRPHLPASPLARILEKKALALYDSYMRLAD